MIFANYFEGFMYSFPESKILVVWQFFWTITQKPFYVFQDSVPLIENEPLKQMWLNKLTNLLKQTYFQLKRVKIIIEYNFMEWQLNGKPYLEFFLLITPILIIGLFYYSKCPQIYDARNWTKVCLFDFALFSYLLICNVFLINHILKTLYFYNSIIYIYYIV